MDFTKYIVTGVARLVVVPEKRFMRNPTLVLPKVFRNVTWPHLADACAVCLEAFWLNDWRRMALPWDGPPTPTQKFILNGQIVVSSAMYS